MPSVLGALARALLTPAAPGADGVHSLSPALLRDVLQDDACAPPERRHADPRRPVSFRMHPASEFFEARDTSALASLPRIGDRDGVQ